jgi:hypothetical protein
MFRRTVVLPEGYTFVRPFTRDGGDQPQVVEVRSRGLASLLALGVRVSRRGGNPSTRSQLHRESCFLGLRFALVYDRALPDPGKQKVGAPSPKA